MSMSIFQDLELEGGKTLYVQIARSYVQTRPPRACLSVDGADDGHTFWLTLEELKTLSAMINKAVKEYEHGAKVPTIN